MDWGPIALALFRGTQVTLLVAVISLISAIAIGMVLAAAWMVPNPVLRATIRAYVEVWRGVPLIVTVFLAFFVVPKLGIDLGSIASGTAGLTLWGSANMTEVVRGALQSIPRGQSEAARALGMNSVQGLRYVVIPQALPRMLPPGVGLAAYVIQSSSYASVVGVPELLEQAHRTAERLLFVSGDSAAAAVMTAVMLVYFALCYPLLHFARRYEGGSRTAESLAVT